jgi:hypothetical protein
MVVVDARTYEVEVEPIGIPKAHWRMQLFKWLGRVRNRLAFGKQEGQHKEKKRNERRIRREEKRRKEDKIKKEEREEKRREERKT